MEYVKGYKLPVGTKVILNRDIDQSKQVFKKGDIGVITKNNVIEFCYVVDFAEDFLPVYTSEIELYPSLTEIPIWDILSVL